MKNLIYLLTLTFLTHNTSLAQTQDSTDTSANQISIGVKDKLYSEILGEDREIWVHVPASSIYGEKYPVLFLLDGEYHFETVVGLVKANVINRLIPEMIIVAIRNTNRYRDLTTVHVGDDADPSGGADKFTKFIESELIPYVDSKYPTISYRTFIGHSLGGLVVVNTLMKHPHLFNSYLAIDPSLSWGDSKLLKEARSTMEENEFKNKSIYLAVANTTNNDEMTFEEALADTTTGTLHLRSIVEFSELAKSKQGLLADWKYYPDESHGTVPVVAKLDAFRFFFSWYEFKHWNEFYMPTPELTGDELVELIASHHANISDKFGHPYLPNEYEVNRLGYMYIDRKDYERALPFFELNIKNYPESANAFDSLGDYYSHTSDTTNAIKYFTKSLELGGVEGTQERLEALKKEKGNR